MKVAIIGDDDFVIGFQMGGVKLVYSCATPDDALKSIEKIRDMRDIAVLVIQRSYADKVREYINEWKHKKDIYPVILELPGYGDREAKEDPMRNVIKRAIGVDIMKR